MVDVEGAIASKSRLLSLQVIGLRTFVLMMLCVFFAMHSPHQNCYILGEQTTPCFAASASLSECDSIQHSILNRITNAH